MKTLLLSAVLSVCSFVSTAAWIQLTPMPTAGRTIPMVFTIAGQAYIGGGFEAGWIYHSDFWKYDPVADSWTQMASLPHPIGGASAFSILNKGYIVNGWINGNNSNGVYEYDPVLNTWATKNSFPGAGRYSSCSFVINSKAYVGLGYVPLKDDFWSYDPVTDTWTQLASFPPGPRQATIHFALNGKGYVATGLDQYGLGNNYSGLNDMYSYNPATNLWTQEANFTGPARHSGISFNAAGKIYVGTGNEGNGSGITYNDFYEYNPSTGGWTIVNTLPGGPRQSAAGFSIGECGFVFGGFDQSNGTYYNDLWKYCFTTDIDQIDAGSIEVVYIQSDDKLSVDFSGASISEAELRIHDAAGKLIRSFELIHSQSFLDMNRISKGIYFYRLHSGQKLIKSGKLSI